MRTKEASWALQESSKPSQELGPSAEAQAPRRNHCSQPLPDAIHSFQFTKVTNTYLGARVCLTPVGLGFILG